jgi:predicted esterase
MFHQSIHFQFKARYVSSAPIDKPYSNIWIVLHGYGQLAPFFIKKFQRLVDDETLIIAPEGLSRFYLEDVTKRVATGNNRVGATWMTREERLTDIENYIHYLQAVYHAVKTSSTSSKVTLLGFSQGAATATRWASAYPHLFCRLIIWAGILPEDLEIQANNRAFKDLPIHLVYGKQDPFLSDDRMLKQQEIEGKLGIQSIIHTFEGGHEIESETLLKFK